MASRRDFLAASAAAVAMTRWPTSVIASPATGRTLLFQGDSITDAGRNRARTGANDVGGMGTGYPLLIAAALRERFASTDLQIYNRGISGNTVPDLQARWQDDTIAIAPSVLSVLIGVNDIWHARAKPETINPAGYESSYAALLAQTRRALPGVRIVVMEPFVTMVGAVDASWFPQFNNFRTAAARVAKGAGATFVPLHEMLQGLARETGPAYWAGDGVHPTLAGHQAIARQWMKVVGEKDFR